LLSVVGNGIIVGDVGVGGSGIVSDDNISVVSCIGVGIGDDGVVVEDNGVVFVSDGFVVDGNGVVVVIVFFGLGFQPCLGLGPCFAFGIGFILGVVFGLGIGALGPPIRLYCFFFCCSSCSAFSISFLSVVFNVRSSSVLSFCVSFLGSFALFGCGLG